MLYYNNPAGPANFVVWCVGTCMKGIKAIAGLCGFLTEPTITIKAFRGKLCDLNVRIVARYIPVPVLRELKN